MNTFPDEEVKYGFLDSLLPVYTQGAGTGNVTDVISLKSYVETGDMHYADTFAADIRKLYKIGVNFSSETRQLTDWKLSNDGKAGN